MIDRRGFLNFFGIGATVAPVIGGLVNHDAQARLIETPAVEILEPPKIIEASAITAGEYEARVVLRNLSTAEIRQFTCTVTGIDLDPLHIAFPRLCPKCATARPGVIMALKEPKRVIY